MKIFRWQYLCLSIALIAIQNKKMEATRIIETESGKSENYQRPPSGTLINNKNIRKPIEPLAVISSLSNIFFALEKETRNYHYFESINGPDDSGAALATIIIRITFQHCLNTYLFNTRHIAHNQWERPLPIQHKFLYWGQSVAQKQQAAIVQHQHSVRCLLACAILDIY